MPFTGTSGGEKISTEKAFPHHALSAANRLRNPLKILAGRQSELKLNLVTKMKRVGTGGTEGVARRLNQVVKVSFVNSWRCRGPTASKSVAR
jgi:hypothetical protein